MNQYLPSNSQKPSNATWWNFQKSLKMCNILYHKIPQSSEKINFNHHNIPH